MRRAERGARGARADRRRRPADRHLLGRHAPPPRRRARHRPPPARPVPRRADDRARPAGPRPHVGRDPQAARARDHGLPDHALPRGGGRARRPPRDHRPRQDRGRGHRRLSSSGRSPATSSRSASTATTSVSSISSAPSRSSARRSVEDELIRLYVDQGDSAVPQLIRLLDGADLRARTLTLARPSLDDVFLRQTGRSLREEPAA